MDGLDQTLLQAPRVTSYLRAIATEPGAHFDIEAHVIRRSSLLAAKRSARGVSAEGGGVGSSELVRQLFGSWTKAPAGARDAYEKFLKAVSDVMGGQPSSSELSEGAMAAWTCLRGLPPPARVRGHGSAVVLKPHRDALRAALGHVEGEAAVAGLVTAHAKLDEWRGSAVLANGKAVSSNSRPDTAPELLDLEFGSDIRWEEERDQGLDTEAAVRRLCGLCAGPSGRSRIMPGQAAAPTPGQIRNWFAEADTSGSQPSSTGAGVFSLFTDNPEEEDLGSEYEEKKRPKEVNLRWLHRWAKKVSGEGVSSVQDEGGGGAGAVALSVCRILLTQRGENSVAAELFELLGDAAVEEISELMNHRNALSAALRTALDRLRDDGMDDNAPVMPSYAPGVTVTSERQKLLAKIERKERRKGKVKGTDTADTDLSLLESLGWDAILQTEEDTSSNVLVFDGGFEMRIGAGSGVQRALPKGTTRKSHKGYEEVYVPAAPKAPPPGENELVKIDSLEEWAQSAFQGYKTLNRIQSRIFKAAFYSNENLLVCAPTGAGKTNIAMIAVLREVGAHMISGIIQRNNFKIVYVAPMKALAAEVTASFSNRLAPLGLKVRELTGDMQLSKRELAETQMIVTTPEKWDVITRKGGDVAVASLVKLLIIDEVHLLNDDRGPVIETLIARTLRQVEASQAMIRIVGLSATLPNYGDVATFLRVNPESGLFHFDASFRPVPLEMQFVGVSEKNHIARTMLMNEICYNKVVESLKKDRQVMVFVHSRKDTGKTARILVEMAGKSSDMALLDNKEHPRYQLAMKDIKKSRNREVVELFESGFGIHHAGMLRGDRSLVERLFADGLLKVLVCTATLAWGINLPAHTVVIKGTQIYDAQKGSFNDLGMLDVQQIFGRAGRPQFEDSGLGIIITSHNKLAHYLGMLTSQMPIESQFKAMMVDNLNAEIVLGTVTNVKEAVIWLSYTYMATRMTRSPLTYAIKWEELLADPSLESHKRALIIEAAQSLKQCQMAAYHEGSGNLYVTELGRVASHFYIRHQSIVIFQDCLKEHMSEVELLAMIAQSSEFDTMAVREEEQQELEGLLRTACVHTVKAGAETKLGKVNILMQAYISRAHIESFSLTADMMYISQNAPRIMRAIFEICLRRKWSNLADACLSLAKSFEIRLWLHQHPLRQFEAVLSQELLSKLEDRNLNLHLLADMEASEIGVALRHPAAGSEVKKCVNAFPDLQMGASLHPITRTVLRVSLSITPNFNWIDRFHGQAMRWHIWVEDSQTNHIYHSELWTLTKKMMKEPAHVVSFTIPLYEPLPSQYFIRAVSDMWLNAEAMHEVSFLGLILPQRMPPHTELLDLEPLPLSTLNNPAYEEMYHGRFTHFNAIQTQAFHTLYHTDESVLLGAPTGSGKTISCELTMLRLFSAHPGSKVIYIAPLKALVRERMEDWSKNLCVRLGKKVAELTGDYTPDARALVAADIIIVTPEKWDGISRSWQSRSYVKHVGLLIIDEIHLLGADRGPILEVIVSRMRYVAAQMDRPIRFVGLSTALANAQDLADWLGISPPGLFNFKPSVRPVPLEAHIQGYPGKFYCPRMASMNKPTYAAIQTHSPVKPILVFVSSRRQTRLTAMDLITYAVADERPGQWCNMSPDEMAEVLGSVRDSTLRHCLQFGIGLHHAGLNDTDRSMSERLFVAHKIQILVATSTLAWGVNTPAHLVVIKGTEFYDAPTKRYVDFPITDVLQMMGRAGRPQYDKHGVAVIMVHEPKKQFYKRFLYEPFPVESSLHTQIPDHFNAEVAGGTIASVQDAVSYLTWTFYFRRLLQNPSYYDLEATDSKAVNDHLSILVTAALEDLQNAGCVILGENGEVEPTTSGRIASFYYLRHTTMATFTRSLGPGLGVKQLLEVLTSTSEYDEMPVRHNEDVLNTSLIREVRFPPDPRTADDPHTKSLLLLQSHMSRLPLPISDYLTDTKSALDNSLRILQAMVDIAADAGWLDTALSTINVIQSLLQGRWPDTPSMLMLPGFDPTVCEALARVGINALPQLMEALGSGAGGSGARGKASVGAEGGTREGENRTHGRSLVLSILASRMGEKEAKEAVAVADRLPVISLATKLTAAVEKTEDAEGLGEERLAFRVELTRIRGAKGSSSAVPPRVYAPRFPKVKEEGWYLVAGDVKSRELLYLRRVSFGDRTSVKVSIPARTNGGVQLRKVTIFLMSDSYIGLDQQYDLVVNKSGNLSQVQPEPNPDAYEDDQTLLERETNMGADEYEGTVQDGEFLDAEESFAAGTEDAEMGFEMETNAPQRIRQRH